MPSDELRIRPYRPDDVEAVRDVCFETGYMGDPVAWQYGDRSSFCHLFCDWYVTTHPDCAWVVDQGGRAVGYLLGAPDRRGLDAHEAAYGRRHLLGRWLWARPGTAGFVWRSVVDLARDRRALAAPVDLEVYPADLHIDLLPAARGRGFGRALMTRWFDRLAERGLPGVHLGTWGENAAAIAFFTSMGFRQVGERVPSPGFRLRDGGRTTVVHLVRSVG